MDDGLHIAAMFEAVQRIKHYAGTRDDFFGSAMARDAVLRNFIVIGEAARNVSEPLKAAHPELPWSDAIGFRNVLAHGYGSIDYAEVWLVIEQHLLKLEQQLITLLPKYGLDPGQKEFCPPFL